MKVISIFGGSGFLGIELIKSLTSKNFDIRVFTRDKKRNRHLKNFTKVRIIEISSESNIKKLLQDSDIIFDLVGILHENKDYTFDDVHAERLKKITNSLSSSVEKRFIHVGALGARKDAPSKYLRSKAKGEEFISKNGKNYHWTIIKPSIIFGEQDKFINLFSYMVKYLPIILLISPYSKFQPIFVKDVVEILIKSIDDRKTYNKTFNIGGPNVYSFLEIIKLIAFSQKRKIWVLPLTKKISYFMVRCIEFLPFKIITRDNLASMSIDNVTKNNDSYIFKSKLKTLCSYLSDKYSKSDL